MHRNKERELIDKSGDDRYICYLGMKNGGPEQNYAVVRADILKIAFEFIALSEEHRPTFLRFQSAYEFRRAFRSPGESGSLGVNGVVYALCSVLSSYSYCGQVHKDKLDDEWQIPREPSDGFAREVIAALPEVVAETDCLKRFSFALRDRGIDPSSLLDARQISAHLDSAFDSYYKRVVNYTSSDPFG